MLKPHWEKLDQFLQQWINNGNHRQDGHSSLKVLETFFPFLKAPEGP